MTGWAVFLESLNSTTIREDVLPPIRRVLAERFGSPEHQLMLDRHEFNRVQFEAHQSRTEAHLAKQRLRVAAEEAADWQSRYEDRSYRFTDSQIAAALAAGRRAA